MFRCPIELDIACAHARERDHANATHVCLLSVKNVASGTSVQAWQLSFSLSSSDRFVGNYALGATTVQSESESLLLISSVSTSANITSAPISPGASAPVVFYIQSDDQVVQPLSNVTFNSQSCFRVFDNDSSSDAAVCSDRNPTVYESDEDAWLSNVASASFQCPLRYCCVNASASTVNTGTISSDGTLYYFTDIRILIRSIVVSSCLYLLSLIFTFVALLPIFIRRDIYQHPCAGQQYNSDCT